MMMPLNISAFDLTAHENVQGYIFIQILKKHQKRGR